MRRAGPAFSFPSYGGSERCKASPSRSAFWRTVHNIRKFIAEETRRLAPIPKLGVAAPALSRYNQCRPGTIHLGRRASNSIHMFAITGIKNVLDKALVGFREKNALQRVSY